MSSVTIKIDNKEYNLVGNEKEEYLHTVANYVDKKIKSIKENNSKLSTSEASILTAMNVVDDLFKCGKDNEKLFDENEGNKEKLKLAEEQIHEFKNELMKVNEEKDQLVAKLEDFKEKQKQNTSNANVEDLHNQISITTEETKKYMEESKKLKEYNKQLKFNIQTARYKLMDLENKYLESQFLLAKAKKEVVNNFKINEKKEG